MYSSDSSGDVEDAAEEAEEDGEADGEVKADSVVRVKNSLSPEAPDTPRHAFFVMNSRIADWHKR
jgi:hypothetical protein